MRTTNYFALLIFFVNLGIGVATFCINSGAQVYTQGTEINLGKRFLASQFPAINNLRILELFAT